MVIETINNHDIWELGSIFPMVARKRFKGVGRGKYALCPFYQETKASFSWCSDRNFFHCFGCGKGGDLIGFYSAMTGKDFIPSVIALAKFFRIKLQFKNILEREEDVEWE
jgi:DNA primase